MGENEAPVEMRLEASGVAIPLQVHAGFTEMGVRIDLHHEAVNASVEVDLDANPVYMLAVLATLPKIVEAQLEALAGPRWQEMKQALGPPPPTQPPPPPSTQ